MNIVSDWPLNRLLLALPPSNLERLMPQLQRIDCRREQILVDADGSLDHVYFPDSGVISVVAVYANGDIIEMATIGREGCSGLQAIFRAKTSSVRFSGPDPGQRREVATCGIQSRHGVDTFVQRFDVFIRAGLPRAGPGVRRLQRRA